jgi:hypothetical protein
LPAPRSQRRLAPLLLALVVLAVPASADAARGLELGFLDGVYAADPAERDAWLDRSAAVSADIVRLDVGWPAQKTPTRPAGFDARDPADPHYDFARADAAIVAATARGMQVLASFTGAPHWADGPGRPADVTPGTWKPSYRALEEYGAALGRRYSGTFPDPARPGQFLPKVRAFQVWNEPNLGKYLNPQWSGRRSTAPALYRRMLTAFYRGVRSVNASALVVTAGTGPFGDPRPGGRRIMPARFWRDVLCLRRTSTGRLASRASCASPASFDVLAHHPYSVGAPRRTALNADDVSIPDIGKLTRLLRYAERKGSARPDKRHPVWVTETSYDSSPPDPDGVEEATHARYLAEAFYLLSRQGVDVITWFQVRDRAPIPSFDTTNQSGVFFRDGRPKLAAAAFRFPFVTERTHSGKLRAWGRSPMAGRLTIERLHGNTWKPVKTLNVRRNDTFLTAVPRAATPDRLRARVATEISLSWTQR